METMLVASAIREGVDPLPANPSDPRQALGALRDVLASCQAMVDHIESAIPSLPAD